MTSPLALHTRVNHDGVTLTGSLNVTVRLEFTGKSVAPSSGKVSTTPGATSPALGVREKASTARPSSELEMSKSDQRTHRDAPFGMFRPVMDALTGAWLGAELPFRRPP